MNLKCYLTIWIYLITGRSCDPRISSNRGLIEPSIKVDVLSGPSNLSPFTNPHPIESDIIITVDDDRDVVPLIGNRYDVYGYIPESLKNLSKTLSNRWSNWWVEDDYPRYQRFSKLVSSEAKDEAISKLAESIDHLGPTIMFRGSTKPEGQLESEDHTGAVVYGFKASLRVLEKDDLSVRERYWALGLFACLRDRLIPSVLHPDDRQLLNPRAKQYRAQLELFLMGGMCSVTDSIIHISEPHSIKTNLQRDGV